MGSSLPPGEEIFLDACCVINLFGSGLPSEILRTLPGRFLIARHVYEREALYTLTDPPTNQRQVIDLNPLIEEGLVQVVDLSSEVEAVTLVDFATRLEAGEAVTCALAVHRGFTVASDERKVLNLLKDRAPYIGTRTTTDLIKWWSDTASASDERVRQVLQNIRSRARFAPGKLDPEKEWWDRRIGPP